MIRYSPETASGPHAIHKTKLLNISETGMGIEMTAREAPQVGERLKVEIPIPGGEQIAWWAVVVRIELEELNWWSLQTLEEEEKVYVGLRFEELPRGHRRAIRTGLEARFLEEIKESRRRQWLYVKAFWYRNLWKIFGSILAFVMAATMLYLLARPTADYDPKYGTPWGQRFIFFDWQKTK
jgi:hypothetical protein